MCVGIENVGISFLTNHMLRAPLFVEAEGVWGIKAVRDSARQDDCGVTGHVGIWRVEKEQLQAVMPKAETELGFCGWKTEFTVFVLFHYSLLPTRFFLSCWFMQSEGAPVDGVDVNHPSVYGWSPTP